MKTLNILIVEQDAVNAAVVEQLLQHIFNELDFEFRLTHTTNGFEGLEHHRASGFDIMFVDVVIPEAYGLDLINEIKFRNQNDGLEGNTIPKLVVTNGSSSKSDRLLYQELGVDYVFKKQINLEEMMACFMTLFDKENHIQDT